MTTFRRLAPALVALPLLLTGCKEASAPPQAGPAGRPADAEEEARIHKALAQLPPADRKLAQAQKFCAVESENRLGSMGKPVKIVVGGETVFVCCKGCCKDAEKHPEQTLARVRQLRKQNAPPPIGM
jgi:hypothetical protein